MILMILMEMFRSRMLLLVFLISVTAAAQSGKVKGKVFCQVDGEPAIGASVYITPGNNKAKTGIDGEYLLLNVPTGTHIITAEYLGYLDTSVVFTIEVNQLLNIDLRLDEVISARGARRDIENGDVKIIISGGFMVRTSSVPLEEEAKLASEYGFRYEYTCAIYSRAAEDEYNAAVYEYLDKRNGKSWDKEFMERYNELEKHYDKSSRND